MTENLEELKKQRVRIASTQQHSASDPAHSVWVEASAGTGKTKVLTDRVLRLLLDGVNPIRLLCLTYTKAAAVEMQTRISQRLSEWAVEDESKLEKSLRELLNDEIKSADALRHYRQTARTLFAKLLDTPGGIKIQTIHSFCADVLQRFPLEAGVSPYFSVLEDEEAQNALAHIKAEILQSDNYRENEMLEKAIDYLMNNMAEKTFDSMLQDIISKRRAMSEIIEKNNGLLGFIRALSDKMEIKDGDTAESIQAEFMDSVRGRTGEIKAIIEAWQHGSPTDVAKAEKLQQIMAQNFLPADYEKYKSCYFAKSSNSLNKGRSLATTGAVNFDPLLLDRLTFEGDLLTQAEKKLVRQKLYQSTKAAFTIAEEINCRYEGYKREHAAMDFNDLIYHTCALFTKSDVRQWVLYKLDGGIDHILLDEAQDTSPEQWDIVAGLCDDFFSGSGQSDINRTLFVVGDRKQSIFSFHGADPEKFDVMSHIFEQKAKEAHKSFERVNLEVSFRSAPAILDAVNQIFASEQAAQGVVLQNQKVEHKPFRVGQFGKVSIMPLLQPEKGEKTHTETDYLQPPTERIYKTALVTKMAETVARQIRKLIDETAGSAHPLHYRDIMVLVRKRDDFVEEFIRACEKEQVSISGADKMVLSEQIAILDLISLGKFLLFPKDSLSLAEVLTSPLFSIDGPLLEDLCYGRAKGEELWDRVRQDSRCAEICNQLTTLLNNLDYIRPYELFNFVLSTMGGRRKFVERMGQEAEDALDEFINLTLDFEQRQIPSLQGFISWFEQCRREIKRESEEQETDAVRLFTVHHSKGLQAPIVILPDTGTPPSDKREQKLLQDGSLGYYPLSADNYEDLCDNLKDKNYVQTIREYHRLLYVALTRAEDQLYIYAYGNKNSNAWYNLCRQVFAAEGDDSSTKIELISEEFAPKEHKQKAVNLQDSFPLKPWIDQNIEPESATAKPYTPSKDESDEEPDSTSPLQENGKFYRRGTLIHRLLQFLPQNTGNRDKAIDVFLQKEAEDFSASDCRQIKAEVLKLIENPDFAEIFGQNSQAEVPIMGEADGKIISAQIDRLVILPDKVKIVDFKTNRPPAQSIADTPPQYLKQLAAYARLMQKIYPQKRVETYILWTNETRLMKVS